MLEIEKLSSGYGRQKVLKEISFRVTDGCLCGILGPNGSGKSTLIRTFFGIANATSGEIILDGNNLLKMKPEDVAKKVSVQKVSKQPGLMLTVREFVGLGLENPDKALIDGCLSDFRLDEIANRPVSLISDGQHQRASLAQASIKRPRLYLLDEPTSHLDLAFKHRMLSDIRSRLADGSMALAIIHDIDIARKYCDMVVLLGSGQIVETGEPSLLDDPVVTTRLYGLDLNDRLR